MSPDEEREAYQTVRYDRKNRREPGRSASMPFGCEGRLTRSRILQQLGFLYHINDVSRDEPFTVSVRRRPFAVVPYTIRNNDIVRFDSPALTVDGYTAELKAEFDQLYAEAVHRRRMMSISTQ